MRTIGSAIYGRGHEENRLILSLSKDAPSFCSSHCGNNPISSHALRTTISPAPEQPFDVGEAQLDVSGTAVIALAAMRRRLHLAQQRIHLGLRQAPAGADAAAAGERSADFLAPLLERPRVARRRQPPGDGAHPA